MTPISRDSRGLPGYSADPPRKNLAIIPVVNKVDMKNADVDRVEAQMARPGYTEYSCATRVPPARHLRVDAGSGGGGSVFASVVAWLLQC